MNKVNVSGAEAPCSQGAATRCIGLYIKESRHSERGWIGRPNATVIRLRPLGRRALTLIEVCVAMALLAVFVLIASGLESQGLRALKSIQHRQTAQRLASDLEEQLRAGLPLTQGDQPLDGWAYHYLVKQAVPKNGLQSFEITVAWKSLSQQNLSLSRSGQRLSP